MDKYEISLWEDYQDTVTVDGQTKTFLNERKLCIIGAETMTAQVRALEPKFVQNVNGTHTLTFKMFYRYNDTETGEEYENPFLYLLVNERKVKVRWENEWYDLVIKKCQENTSEKSIVYTCTDLFINELSKNGFELNFCNDLENNIGTVSELASATLEGSTWQFDSTNSDQIFQYVEESVYEVTSSRDISCYKQVPGGTDTNETINNGKEVLVFYSSVSAILDGCNGGIPPTEMQILYSPNGYQYRLNSVVVANGDCYLIKDITSTFNDQSNILTIKQNNNTILTIQVGQGVSEYYRAERLVKSPRTEFDKAVDRYVTVCRETSNNKKVYLIETTDYTDPLTVVNIIANPNQYKNVNGWIAIPGNVNEIKWQIYPKFNSNTQIASYTAKSYIKLAGTVYNSGLSSNISYFTPTSSEIKDGKLGGFEKGEKYVFRFKAVTNSSDSPTTTAVTGNVITFDIKTSSATHAPSGNSYCSSTYKGAVNSWIEYEITFNQSVTANEIKGLGIFITPKNNAIYWFEDIQFFKYVEGKTSYAQDAQTERMEPGEISLQGIVEKKYKYYYPNDSITDAKDIKFIYVGDELNNDYPIQYNNYEKLASITIKQSNRFNILQTIAETFKCWVRFKIEHDNTGKVIFTNGVPQKFVVFKAEIGEDKSVCFEYGIDLKSISRTVDSDNLATKVIVLDNSNEFAPNGFCTIMRSSENYSKASFILNFDYYIQQGLLSKDQIQKDLYGTSANDIGYYYHLRWYNRDYDALSSELSAKYMQLVKQESQLITYKQYLTAAEEKRNSIIDDLEKLAGVTSLSEAQIYAQNHTNNTKVQSLLNAYAEVNNQINSYQGLITDGENTVDILKDHINTIQSQCDDLLDSIEALNKTFNDKYANYLQEGTWQDESYTDDNKYYLDAVGVAYTSSRPQLTYSINVVRLSTLEEFSSKVFHVGDICYIIDREYFGYSDIETKTPYKEQIVVTEITSNFDSPEKDTIQVKNYKTKFDDLFQRIAAQTQSLKYSEGGYARAADAVNSDRTLSFSLLQDTFDMNENLVLNASNQNVTWDETGITVTNKLNAADKTKIIAGGIFVTNDGGITWKNAVRGDGISTDLLTAGRINTSEIYVYDGNHPTFRWDSDGLTAYWHDGNGANYGRFVRHDRFGLYGYSGSSNVDFIPNSEASIWNNTNTKFALTWKGFMLRTSRAGGGVQIKSLDSSSTDDIVIQATNSSGATTFALHENGNVELGGNVTWNPDSNPTKVVYNQSGSSVPAKPTLNYSSYPSNYTTGVTQGWHTVLASNDIYGSYNYSGGVASQWSNVVQIAGASGSDAEVNRANIMASLLRDDYTQDGIYAVTIGGKNCIGIRATAIQAGIINASITMTSPTIYCGSHSSYGSTASGFYLSSSGLSIGSGFKVDSSGNMTLSGNITWNTNSNPTKVLYTQVANSSKPNQAYSAYNNTSTTTWHKTLGTNDKYGSYSYDGGTASSWSEVVQIVGKDGASGTGISSIIELYAKSDNSSSAPSTGWQSTPPELDPTYKYLWNKETITYTNGNTTTTAPQLIGSYSADGRSITSITEYYQASSTNVGVTKNTGTWVTTPTASAAIISSSKPYLWNYEKVNYSTTDLRSYPEVTATYGGTSTITCTSAIEYFAKSSSNSTEPATWTIVDRNTSGYYTLSNTLQPDATNKYLWNYRKLVYDNGFTVTTTKKVIYTYSVNCSVDRFYWYSARSSSSSTIPSSGFIYSAIPVLNGTTKYLWGYERIIQSYNTESNPVVIGRYGSDATVNRTNIVNAIAENLMEQEDGIYSYTYNNKKYIGLRASAIQAGKITAELEIVSPKLYSSSHNSLTSSSNGFYLGSDGFSIGNKFRVTDGGTVYVGYGAYATTPTQCWTIMGNNNNSYIRHGEKGASGAVYIGTDQINLGGKFIVDNQGNITLSGDITWSSSSKPWSEDIPDVSDYITSDEATTIISDKLVASPTIKGASICGGGYYDLRKNAKLYIVRQNATNYLWFGENDSSTEGLLTYATLAVYTQNEQTYLYIGGAEMIHNTGESENYFYPTGTWDFSQATVKGLD